MADGFNSEVELAQVETQPVYLDESISSPVSRLSGKYVQTSEFHKRSFADEKVSSNVIWGDEYGNKFMALNVKGRPPKGAIPYVEEDSYSKEGLRVHYLCDMTDIDRVNIASKVMRSNQLPTERIRSFSKITSIEINGKLVDISELKSILYSTRPTFDHIGYETVNDYIDRSKFYVIEREMPINERIADLNLADSEELYYATRYEDGNITYKGNIFTSISEFDDYVKTNPDGRAQELLKIMQDNPNLLGIIDTGELFKKVLAPAFRYLKMSEGIELDINNNEDIKSFLRDILPTRIGKYLGKFHQLGLKHTSPGSKNWLLAGTLIDLDSVHGKPMGDELTTDKDFADDLQESVGAVYSIFLEAGKYVQFGFIDKMQRPQQGRLTYQGFVWSLWNNNPDDIKKTESIAITNMLRAYCEVRGINAEYVSNHIDMGTYPEVNLGNL